jgi:CheY-like chemotaxis protein
MGQAWADQSALCGLQILVVDDIDDSRRLASRILTRCGATVYEARSVLEALAQMESNTPDVLVSDISMPGRDGYDLIREVRARERTTTTHVPALAMSGVIGESDRHLCIERGFERFIAKPVDVKRLVTLVADLARWHPTVADPCPLD